MNEQILFALIFFFVVAGFALDRLLSWLNARNWKEEVPDEMMDYYDEKEYKRSGEYERAHSRFGFISAGFSLIMILLMLFLDGFAWLDEYLRTYTTHTYGLTLLYFAVLFLVSDLLSMPFSIYNTFVIEERFGFNKTTPKTFVLDKLKGFMLAVVLGGGFVSAFIFIYNQFGSSFWIYAWLLLTAFMLLMTMFYASWIVPLFNKLTPLPEGELRTSIEAFCAKVGFGLTDLYVMDGSKRSSKSNAYFSGLGPKKKIVLFDTLIERQETSEIVAVLAHEIGHYKMKHTRLAIILSIIQTGLMLFLLSLVLDSTVLTFALGAENWGLHLGLIGFSLLYSPLSTITGIFMNIVSRKNEFEADAYAASHYEPESMIRALKKLSVDNLSNLHPHPAYVFVHHSHPPLLSRVAAIKKLAAGPNTSA